MNTWRPFRDYEWLTLAAVLLLLCAVSPASGSGTDVDVDVRQSNDMNNQTAGDINIATEMSAGDLRIGGGSSYALANVLGDVDISGCIITKQTTFIVFAHQYYVYDPWCVARELDMMGRYEAAAKMRCTEKKNRKVYGKECEFIMNFDPGEAVVPVPVPVPESEPTYDYEAAYAAQQVEIEDVREQLATVIEQQSRAPTRAVHANTAVLDAMKQRDTERAAKEEEAKAFFRVKYEAAQQRELNHED